MGLSSLFKSKTKFTLPSWVKEPTKIASDKATDLLNNTQYQAYNQPRVAGLSDTQTSALDQFKQLMGSGTATPRLIDNVPGMSGGAVGSTEDYMDPHLRSVLDPILRQISESTQQNMQGVDAKAHMAGAFGDVGHAVERAETAQRGTQAASDATGKGYSDAFATAMGMKESDINRMSNNKQQQANLLQMLFGLGQNEQATEQAGLDANYSEFLRQQGFDVDTLAKLTSIIGALPQGTAKSSPSIFSQLLAGGTAIASAAAGVPPTGGGAPAGGGG